MKVDLFDYPLPAERIAQRPLEDRTQSRLLVLDRVHATRTHGAFTDLPRHLPPRSVLVLNDTAVIPARLAGVKRESQGRAEVFLLQRIDRASGASEEGERDGSSPTPKAEALVGRMGAKPLETMNADQARISAESDPFRAPAAGEPSWGRWTAFVSPAKRMRPGLLIDLAHGATATVLERVPSDPSGGTFEVALEGTGAIAEGLRLVGAPPLPPYIHRDAAGPDAADMARYQTVFATKPGAVAAPTAGLHFTPAILEALAAAGHEIVRVTLHVGAGTFLPVRVDDTQDHHMHKERFEIPEAAAEAIARARRESRRVIAIGTTSLRALESASRDGGVSAGEGVTNLFCTPGFRFRVVDHLFTNFHQPRSTLLMLVSAFAGVDEIRAAYADALEKQYRFLSYGDAMLIL